MTSKTLSRNTLLKQSFVMIYKDKEVLLFTLLPSILLVASFLMGIYVIYLLVFKAVIAGNFSSPVIRNPLLFLLLIWSFMGIFALIAQLVTTFYSAAIILTISHRLNGSDPHVSTTLHEVLVKRKLIFHAFTAKIIPFKNQFLTIWWAKRFLLQEMLLSQKTPQQAIDRGTIYAEQAWAKDILLDLKWSGISIFSLVFGLAIPSMGLSVARMLNLINYANIPLLMTVLVSIIALTVGYFVIYYIVINTASIIYETLIYIHYVDKSFQPKISQEKEVQRSYWLLIKNVTSGEEKRMQV